MTKVGVCEDSPAILRVVAESLRVDGHEVLLASSGREAVDLFVREAGIDALVIDVGLPDADGRDLCQALRANGVDAPVLMLSALDQLHDRLAGFNAGATDYMGKPFDILELNARVRALINRPGKPAVPEGERAHLVLDPLHHTLSCRDRVVSLSPTEFRMLAAVLGQPGDVVRRQAVVAAAWPDGAIVNANTIDSFARRIRGKLADVDSPLEFQTVRNVGFALR